MKGLIALGFLLVLLSGNNIPELSPGQKIVAADGPIDVEIGHLVPVVVDWNSDGKKDLLVGQFQKGKIRLYLNRGSDEKPVFKDFEYLMAGGKEISLPAG